MGLSRDRHAINVTPLIDILLVLLVIFLVMMPVMMRMENVDIPRKDEGAEPIMPVAVVSVKADLSVVLDEQPVAALDLPAQLRTHLRGIPHLVFVEFEDGVAWDQVVSTVDTIKAVAPEGHVAVRTRE